MAFSKIQSAQLTGLGATGVTVETDISKGLYVFQIVGLADKAVEESRERVISALRNSVGKNPKGENQKVIVSLSPAELKKEGSYFDIAIALGYLTASEHLTIDPINKLFVGELGLNGDVRPIRGLLSIAQWAKKQGITELYIPKDNEREAELVEGVTFYLIPTLRSLIEHLTGQGRLETTSSSLRISTTERIAIDFGDVKGQLAAKRALIIAGSGGHNIVLYGPPGTGKTMLAKAFHGILPTLSNEQFLEVATIYSSIGLIGDMLDGNPPLRAPHHSASHVAIVGGGSNIRPGDITLAHRGVLYLDEFPEFDRRVIESLREPLEEGSITVARARGSVRFPAQFILLAAMNPCPCGYRGSSIKPCTCSGPELARYNKKLSGPILDRIDLWVPVQHIEYESLHEIGNKKETVAVRKQIQELRAVQYERAKKLNSAMASQEVHSKSKLSETAKKQLQQFAQKLKLSPRSYIRTIKVARTIADLDHSETIEEPHILEALQYRPKLD
ncbi:MAG TPA: YifB family Mg chelatase-like AAA ATPase [Candidatus Paceibacterota bacterium]|jgi:magnesium chelatase family protein|nr:YifB family Mg chelatase-like AAA ATPase [Candidatus Paceibacterota bacterium]